MRLCCFAIGQLFRVLGEPCLHKCPALTATKRRWYSHRTSQLLTPMSVHIPCRRADSTYDEAVSALNSLQSNAAEIEAKRHLNKKQSDNISQMIKSLHQLDIEVEDLNKLNIIHIAGTKGKGSTAALTESILRQHGYKTGFFSSPHLVEVRERIRICGLPISQDMFSKYFWDVYDTLKSQHKEGDSMPFYFKFLTLMALKVFLSEGINAAIIEVGIGGRFDSTNMITKPVCCGITSLGIDHTYLLGDTIEEISWQKGGIMKPGCPAVTVTQNDLAAAVLRKCAQEVGSPLFEAPPFDARNNILDLIPNLGLRGEVQLLNASLAVQMCKIFIDRQRQEEEWTTPTHGSCALPLVGLTDKFKTGLKECRWPGRYHKAKRNGITYYFDGAHTVESVAEAFKWFRKDSEIERQELVSSGRQVKTIFMFNRTGLRCPKDLMTPVAAQRSEFKFDMAVFCPILIPSEDHSDCTDRRVIPDTQLSEIVSHKQDWISLTEGSSGTPPRPVHLFPSLRAALSWLNRDKVPGPGGDVSQSQEHGIISSPEPIADDVYLQVFVTGSLYLVGNSFYFLKEQV